MKKLLLTRENGTYLGIWLTLYLAPVIMQFVLAHESGADFTWNGAMLTWMQLTAFLITFILHNIFVAPLLIFKRKLALYLVLASVLLALFVFVQNSYSTNKHHNKNKQKVENTQGANVQKWTAQRRQCNKLPCLQRRTRSVRRTTVIAASSS